MAIWGVCTLWMARKSVDTPVIRTFISASLAKMTWTPPYRLKVVLFFCSVVDSNKAII